MHRIFGSLLIALLATSLFAKDNSNGKPTANIVTTTGTLSCELYPDKAPVSVRIFAGLATGTIDWQNPKTKQIEHNKPLYSGTTIHNTIRNYLIQGGDPTGTGKGGPGFAFKDEINDLKFDRSGRLAMANMGPNTNGSQFFITVEPARNLDGKYTIFGQCDNKSMIADISNENKNPQTGKAYLPIIVRKIEIKNYTPPADIPAPTVTAPAPAAAPAAGETKK